MSMFDDADHKQMRELQAEKGVTPIDFLVTFALRSASLKILPRHYRFGVTEDNPIVGGARAMGERANTKSERSLVSALVMAGSLSGAWVRGSETNPA